MKIYDVTLPIQPTLALWPGDMPYCFQLNSTICDGATINLGSVTMSLHTGTHADAPFHFQEGGATIERLPLDVYIGPALVLDVSGKPTITPDDLPPSRLAQAPRLLLRTNGWPDLTRFPETIPVLAPNVPAYLRAHGVILLGLDIPSVDALDSKDLPNHHALAANGIHILESLRLNGVPEGVYELLALPLNFIGTDASPIRAVLRTL